MNDTSKLCKIAIKPDDCYSTSRFMGHYQIYDANKISVWVNDYVPLIVQVCSWLGRHLPNSTNTWEDWNKYPENDVEYVQDEILSGHISQLKDHFIGAKKVARIVGLSGLGKTRLALEVFRPPENPQENIKSQAITDQVVYIDAADDSDGLQSIIKQWRDQKLEGIINTLAINQH